MHQAVPWTHASKDLSPAWALRTSDQMLRLSSRTRDGTRGVHQLGGLRVVEWQLRSRIGSLRPVPAMRWVTRRKHSCGARVPCGPRTLRLAPPATEAGSGKST